MGNDLLATAGLVLVGWFCLACVVAALVALLFIGGRCRQHGPPPRRQLIRGESLPEDEPAEAAATR